MPLLFGALLTLQLVFCVNDNLIFFINGTPDVYYSIKFVKSSVDVLLSLNILLSAPKNKL
jgi:hypothetical protein